MGDHLINKIDYSNYSLNELREALESIDAEKYPENFQRLQDELTRPERTNPEVLNEYESTSIEKVINLKCYFVIVVGAFIVFWGYLASNIGVIHKRRSDEVLASLESNPEEFYIWVYLSVGIGVVLMAAGIFAIYKNNKHNTSTQEATK